MILFADWRIQADGEVIARQYDNLSRSIVIVGDIPDGYTWDLLVQAGHNLNIIRLSEMDGGIGVVLTAEMLSVSGLYTMQLRGTLQSDGATVRHTNKISANVPPSLSGDAQWPELPSEFTQMEQRMEELNNHPPTPGANGTETAGTMVNNGAVAGTIDGMTGTGYTVPAGYHSGTGTVTLTDSIEQALAAI